MLMPVLVVEFVHCFGFLAFAADWIFVAGNDKNRKRPRRFFQFGFFMDELEAVQQVDVKSCRAYEAAFFVFDICIDDCFIAGQIIKICPERRKAFIESAEYELIHQWARRACAFSFSFPFRKEKTRSSQDSFVAARSG